MNKLPRWRSAKPGNAGVWTTMSFDPEEGLDDNGKDDDSDRLLPNIAEGDVISLDELRPAQDFTEPPPR